MGEQVGRWMEEEVELRAARRQQFKLHRAACSVEARDAFAHDRQSWQRIDTRPEERPRNARGSKPKAAHALSSVADADGFELELERRRQVDAEFELEKEREQRGPTSSRVNEEGDERCGKQMKSMRELCSE